MLCSLGENAIRKEWNKELSTKIMDKERMQEGIVSKHEGLRKNYDEDCRENEDEGEWSIPFKIGLGQNSILYC